jgi:tetratricopeptide (TPR) repeat protein
MFFGRKALPGLFVCALAWPAAAQGLGPFASTPDNLHRYRQCMSLARSEPLRALPVAKAWQGQGGGLGARHCTAIAMFEAGRYVEAANQLESIAHDLGQERPGLRAQLLGQVGQAWSQAGQPDKAAAAQSQALDLNPKDPDLWIDRGLSYATLRDWPRAISDFDHALALRANDVQILVLRSAAWRHAGEPARSLADAQRALEIAPDNTDALLERGFTNAVRGDKAAAEADFKKVLSLVPPDSEAAKRAQAGLRGDSAAGDNSPTARPAKSQDKR